MATNLNTTLVALAGHMGAYSDETGGVLFLVPAEFYTDGQARRFSIPPGKYQTRSISKKRGADVGVYADRYYCLSNGIKQIRAPMLRRYTR